MDDEAIERTLDEGSRERLLSQLEARDARDLIHRLRARVTELEVRVKELDAQLLAKATKFMIAEVEANGGFEKREKNKRPFAEFRADVESRIRFDALLAAAKEAREAMHIAYDQIEVAYRDQQDPFRCPELDAAFAGLDAAIKMAEATPSGPTAHGPASQA